MCSLVLLSCDDAVTAVVAFRADANLRTPNVLKAALAFVDFSSATDARSVLNRFRWIQVGFRTIVRHLVSTSFNFFEVGGFKPPQPLQQSLAQLWAGNWDR